MKIKVLGSGCAKCKKLYETTREAIDSLGLDCEIEKKNASAGTIWIKFAPK